MNPNVVRKKRDNSPAPADESTVWPITTYITYYVRLSGAMCSATQVLRPNPSGAPIVLSSSCARGLKRQALPGRATHVRVPRYRCRDLGRRWPCEGGERH